MTFQPGQSGNPGGRPKSKGLADYVRSKTRNGKALVEFWLSILESTSHKVTTQDKLKAAAELADRGFGKPEQQTKLTGIDDGPVSILLRWSNGSDSETD